MHLWDREDRTNSETGDRLGYSASLRSRSTTLGRVIPPRSRRRPQGRVTAVQEEEETTGRVTAVPRVEETTGQSYPLSRGWEGTQGRVTRCPEEGGVHWAELPAVPRRKVYSGQGSQLP